MVEPEHIGLVTTPAVTVVPALTVTVTVETGLEPQPSDAVTEYVPDMAVVAFVIVGFCRLDANPLGPVQL